MWVLSRCGTISLNLRTLFEVKSTIYRLIEHFQVSAIKCSLQTMILCCVSNPNPFEVNSLCVVRKRLCELTILRLRFLNACSFDVKDFASFKFRPRLSNTRLGQNRQLLKQKVCYSQVLAQCARSMENWFFQFFPSSDVTRALKNLA